MKPSIFFIILVCLFGLITNTQAQEFNENQNSDSIVFVQNTRHGFNYKDFDLIEESNEFVMCMAPVPIKGNVPIWIGYTTQYKFTYQDYIYQVRQSNSGEYFILLKDKPYLIYLNRVK